jgi:hypothetical protein
VARKIATGTILVTGTAVTEATDMEATEVTNTDRLRQLGVGRYSPNTRRLCSSSISSAMLVRDSRTSSANGAFGRHERQDNAGMRLVTAASLWRSSVRKSIALMVRQAGQHTQRNQ